MDRQPADARSAFGEVELYPGDPVFALNAAFQRDPRSDKINLTVGVYVDQNGRVPVLSSVRSAMQGLSDMPRPYLPLEGAPDYRLAAAKLVMGEDHPKVKKQQYAAIQTIGGTGAVAVAADFLAKHCPKREVLIADPTWENHHGLFERAGFQTSTYPLIESGGNLDKEGMIARFDSAQPGSIIIIQPCCQNPTGAEFDDPSWAAISEVLENKRHIIVFDMAYQGFGTSLTNDARIVRDWVARGNPLLIASSFSKNMSLYGERCGSLIVPTHDADEAQRVLSQLALAVRRQYSCPTTTGAVVIPRVLEDPGIRPGWEEELRQMRDRIAALRVALRDACASIDPSNPAYDRLLAQTGMFAWTGLSEEAVRAIREEKGIFLLGNGRINVAGLLSDNLERVAEALAEGYRRDKGEGLSA